MTAAADGWSAILRREFRRRLIEEQLPRISRCARLLGDEGVWERPSPNTNAVGNLILHLCGNTTQWILAQFTELPDQRRREQEFAAAGGRSVDELCAQLEAVYRAACEVVDAVTEAQLLSPRTVQGYDETGLSAVLHVLEHTSGHAGQIYSWTKQATGVDLAFYDL
ncbi:MAG: DinB family protein [Planctomycetota bacterium]